MFEFALLAQTAAKVQDSGFSWTDSNMIGNYITGAGALLGFFAATVGKYYLDYRAGQRNSQNARKTLASELLADLRGHSDDLIRTNRAINVTELIPRKEDETTWNLMIDQIRRPQLRVYEASIGKMGVLGADVSGHAIYVFSSFQNIADYVDKVEKSNREYRSGGAARMAARTAFFYKNMCVSIDNLDNALSKIADVATETMEERVIKIIAHDKEADERREATKQEFTETKAQAGEVCISQSDNQN